MSDVMQLSVSMRITYLGRKSSSVGWVEVIMIKCVSVRTIVNGISTTTRDRPKQIGATASSEPHAPLTKEILEPKGAHTFIGFVKVRLISWNVFGLVGSLGEGHVHVELHRKG